ncbi:hypothetical protein BGX31_007133 [Mortierella sp. GBA43]|nr:hypothetical protein BGX31_007133 [Mortierella sp. GBA43]
MATAKNSHRSRASSFLASDTSDHQELSYSNTASPRLQVLSGTGSPFGEGSWISLPGKELPIEDDYSEIEYSDMDGEDDMIYDTPPYYSYEDDHPQQQQHAHLHTNHQQHVPRQMQPGRPLAFAGRGDYTGFPTSSSASSSIHSLQEQDQVEEALRARY